MTLNPDVPAQEMRLHMGEITAREMLVARAAIEWANSHATQDLRAAEDTIEAMAKALEEIKSTAYTILNVCGEGETDREKAIMADIKKGIWGPVFRTIIAPDLAKPYRKQL